MGEEQGVPGDGLAGVGARRAALDELADPFGLPLSSTHFQQRADDGSDHVPQEAVRRHAKHQIVALLRRIMQQGDVRGRVSRPLGKGHRADR